MGKNHLSVDEFIKRVPTLKFGLLDDLYKKIKKV